MALAGEGCPWEMAWLPMKKPFPGSWVSGGGTRTQGNGVKDGSLRALVLQALLLCALQGCSHHPWLCRGEPGRCHTQTVPVFSYSLEIP